MIGAVSIKKALALKQAPDILEHGLDVPLWETNLAEACDIRKLLTPALEQYHRLAEPEPALEEAGFVYDVGAGTHGAICLLIFSCHYQ